MVSNNVILVVEVSHNAIPSNNLLPVCTPCMINEEVVEPFALSPLGMIGVASSACSDLTDVTGVVQQLNVGDDGAASPVVGFSTGTMVTWPLSDGDDPLSKSFDDPLFTVPITIVPRDIMLSHLSRDSEVLRCDWLHDENSIDDESFNEDDSASRENFDLSSFQIIDAEFRNKSIKR